MSFILLGLVVGILSGVLGLGGGVFSVPALIVFFHFGPYEAQGTSLAVLIPPYRALRGVGVLPEGLR